MNEGQTCNVEDKRSGLQGCRMSCRTSRRFNYVPSTFLLGRLMKKNWTYNFNIYISSISSYWVIDVSEQFTEGIKIDYTETSNVFNNSITNN